VQAVGLGASYDNPSEAAILLFVVKGQSSSNLPPRGRRSAHAPHRGGQFPQQRVLSQAESAALEQSAPPQRVYPISDAEVARAKVVHASHVDEWMKMNGVQGVGITSSIDSPGEAALMIFLIQGVPHPAIPPVIDGLRTRVRESTRVRAGLDGSKRTSGCPVPPTRKSHAQPNHKTAKL
jgi:hypothetical protein